MAERDYQVRPAFASEVPRLLEIAAAVQDKLTRAGSAQQIAGYTYQNLEERVRNFELYVLELSGCPIGSAIVEPVTPERFPQISTWNAVPVDCTAWFLYGLIISPTHQGRGWGRVLLDGLCRQVPFASPAVLLLDCWAGNATLRRFYAEAGFELHGEFPEEDYWIAVFRRQLDEKAKNPPLRGAETKPRIPVLV